MFIPHCLIVINIMVGLAAQDFVASQTHIISEIESGHLAATGGIRQLAKLGDETYLSSLPVLLDVLELRQVDESTAMSLLSTLSRVNREIPAPLLARIKVWTSGATDGNFLTLLEVRQSNFRVLRDEAELVEKTQNEDGLRPLTNGASPPSQAVETSP